MAEMLHNKVEKSLRSQGMRYTPNRRELVTALEDTSGPLTVDQIYQATRQKVPFSSIYREVRALFEAEVLSLIRCTDRSNRFELAEWLSSHHHHIVCVRCMAISDISLPPKEESQLAELVEGAATDTGYLINDHTLEIEGVCPDCQS